MEIPQDLSKILPEARHLGQRSMLPENYDPSLLVRVPREVNRLKAKIAQPLPFVGFDVWQAYEASCLTASGLPTQCVLKIVYPADSTFFVESKSLKLYLHSLNSTMLGETPRAARHAQNASRATFRNFLRQPCSAYRITHTPMVSISTAFNPRRITPTLQI